MRGTVKAMWTTGTQMTETAVQARDRVRRAGRGAGTGRFLLTIEDAFGQEQSRGARGGSPMSWDRSQEKAAEHASAEAPLPYHACFSGACRGRALRAGPCPLRRRREAPVLALGMFLLEERAVQDHRAFAGRPFIMARECFAGHHAAKEEGAWRRYWCSAWGIC